MKLFRFWIEFETPVSSLSRFGVTAWTHDDALNILKERLNQKDLHKIFRSIEDININDLDKNHVIPNIGSPSERGIWFPIGV